MSWARYVWSQLKMWREAVKAVAAAVRDLGLNADVYVIGGAAEGRLTVLSDVDVLVCLRNPEQKHRGLAGEILWRAVDKFNLPWDYPVEIHVVGEEECQLYLKRSHIRADEL